MTIYRKHLLFLPILFLLHQSVSNGGNWVPLERKTTSTLTRLCFLSNSLGWVAGESGTILKTTDGGATWAHQVSGIPWAISDLFFVDETHGWAIAPAFPDTTFEYGTFVLRTTDGGDTWNDLWIADDVFLTVFFHDTSRGLIAGDRGKILKTNDGGITWLPANVDSSIVGSMIIRRLKFYSEQVGFGLGGRIELIGAMWRTTNGGENWTAAPVGADPILDLHFFDSLNILGISGGFDDGTSMIRSTDGGESWEYEYIGLLGEPRSISFRTHSEAWCPLGFAGNAKVSYDSGRKWSEFILPENVLVYDVVFTDSVTGFMAGQHGRMLKYVPETVHVEEPIRDLHPHAPIILHHNYPNPFNPVTTIAFDLFQRGHLWLTVFDGIGKEVRKLDLGAHSPGVHSMTLNTQGLASGAYFYRIDLLQEGGWGISLSEVRKLTILR